MVPGEIPGRPVEKRVHETPPASANLCGCCDRDHAAEIASRVVVDPVTGCHIWTGAINVVTGYGQVKVHRVRSVHKFAYELAHGPVPDGFYLDHFVCDRHACVNPEHVRPVTPRENALRGDSVAALNRAKLACVHGHPFNEANTYLRPDNGNRQCRACKRDRDRRGQRVRGAA